MLVVLFKKLKVHVYVRELYNFMKNLHIVAFILLVVGGLNWGLSALGYNLVTMLLGMWPMAEKAVYLLVAVSAVFELVTHKKNCTMCNGK